MSNTARLATAIAIVILALTAPPVAADLEQVADPLSHEVTVVNATAEQQALVDWALDRYEAAGLPIPSITITFHTDAAGCHDYLGYYEHTRMTLEMCNWGQHYKITTASTLLHELAHAWSFEYMSVDDRNEFTEHQGLDHWHHHDGAWWHMGQEQAAEIIAWGIGGADFASVYLDEGCTELADAYTMMTGTEPPHQSCGRAA